MSRRSARLDGKPRARQRQQQALQPVTKKVAAKKERRVPPGKVGPASVERMRCEGPGFAFNICLNGSQIEGGARLVFAESLIVDCKAIEVDHMVWRPLKGGDSVTISHVTCKAMYNTPHLN